MGLIKEQTIKGTIINYIGIGIGFVTTAILTPLIDSEVIGLVSVIISYSIIISNLGGLGLNGITVKLFPYFRTKDNKNNGFLFLSIGIALVGFALASLIVIILKDIAYSNRSNDDLFLQYYYYIIPVVFFQIFFNLFDNYYKVIFDAIKGIYLREFVQKLGTLFAIFMMVSGFLSLDAFVFVYLLGFSLPGILIIIIAIFDRKNHFRPHLDFVDPSLKKSIISVGIFSIVSGASGIIAINIDKIMIEDMTNLSNAGVYTVAFYFGLIISIPARSLIKIASALITEAMKNNNMEEVNSIYKKSSINLFIFGSLFLTGLYINVDNIVILLSNDYGTGINVILIIGLAFLVDMLGGTASQILFVSHLYKLQTYIMIAFVFFVIITNYIFIPLYGITGAAIATLISKVIINFIRFIIIYKSFKLQPYNYKFLLIIMISGLLLLVNYFLIPKQENFIIDIILRSSITAIIYLIFIYIFNISEDINQQLNQIYKTIRQKKK